MIGLKPEDIIRMNAEVARFGEIADLKFKAMPVIMWEFADRGDFYHARDTVMRAMSKELVYDPKFVRSVPPDTFELDCYGVTLRLRCIQRIAKRGGSMGAIEAEAFTVRRSLP